MNFNPITAIISAVTKPVADVINKKTERKIASESASAKLQWATQEGNTTLEFNEQEIEAIRTKGLESTWKDEYITVSFMSIVNLIVIGGVASAFGYDQILVGTAKAIGALSLAGVEVGKLMTYTVLAGLGLSVWRKL